MQRGNDVALHEGPGDIAEREAHGLAGKLNFDARSGCVRWMERLLTPPRTSSLSESAKTVGFVTEVEGNQVDRGSGVGPLGFCCDN